MNVQTHRTRLAVVVALTAVLVNGGCGDSASPTRPRDGIVQISANAFAFDPNDLALTEGESAMFVISSRDMAHTFTIDELGIDVAIPAGETRSVEVAGPAGSYAFYCGVPGHRDRGMEGRLRIGPRAPVGTTGGRYSY